jgi:bacterioferritin
MKGHQKIIDALNDRLREELTAISQYMVQSEMCANWGYDKLHAAIEKQAVDEMHHAEWLIGRIIFLEGAPGVSKLDAIKVGKTVKDMIGNDREAEAGAIRAYNETMALAVQLGDNATRDLLAKILQDEERHVDWDEQQRDQIEQMGLENYLANQA